MADVNGVYYDNYYSDSPPTIGSAGQFDGRLKVMYDEYECSSTAAGTEILIGKKMNAGAVIHHARIYNDALGTGVTLALAARTLDDGTETVYVSAAAAATAGIIEPDVSDIGTLPQAQGEDFVNIIQVAGAEADGTIKVEIFYSEH